MERAMVTGDFWKCQHQIECKEAHMRKAKLEEEQLHGILNRRDTCSTTNMCERERISRVMLKNTRNLGSILHGACTFGRRETSEIEAEYRRHIACCLLDEVGPTERHSERKRDELNVR
jgi:hypothetical protein